VYDEEDDVLNAWFAGEDMERIKGNAKDVQDVVKNLREKRKKASALGVKKRKQKEHDVDKNR
jgi:hypothetical protein